MIKHQEEKINLGAREDFKVIKDNKRKVFQFSYHNEKLNTTIIISELPFKFERMKSGWEKTCEVALEKYKEKFGLGN